MTPIKGHLDLAKSNRLSWDLLCDITTFQE